MQAVRKVRRGRRAPPGLAAFKVLREPVLKVFKVRKAPVGKVRKVPKAASFKVLKEFKGQEGRDRRGRREVNSKGHKAFKGHRALREASCRVRKAFRDRNQGCKGFRATKVRKAQANKAFKAHKVRTVRTVHKVHRGLECKALPARRVFRDRSGFRECKARKD